MAQANDIQRTSNAQSGHTQHIKSTSKGQTSPTFQQLLQREGSKWSQISTEKLKKKNNQDHNGNHHNKKSVLAKVKEKAKKLKHSLSIKKHHHENDPPSTSVTCVSTTDSKDKGREDVEFHSARMSQSKNTPNNNIHATKDLPQEAPTPIPNTHSAMSKDEPACSSNTIRDTDSKNHAPLDTSLVAADSTDAKYQVPSTVVDSTDTKNQTTTTADVCKEHDSPGSNSRFSNLTVSTSSKGERSIEEGEKMKGESQRWDKGVSVKEYLMQKFEPGEDERALSQIITQTISPRRDKVREAMSSFLRNEEPCESSTSKISNNDTNPILKSTSLPASVLSNNTEPKIGSIVQSHSLGSNEAKNLNQTFKSTIASYQSYINSSATSSSSPNKNADHLHSPIKSSSSPLGHANMTHVPNHSELNNMVGAPLSTATQAQGPGKADEYDKSSTTRVPAYRNLLGVVEEENDGRIQQAK